jgi:hypothetical protein
MEEYFSCLPVSNSTSLCVGAITNAEVDRARADGAEYDGKGYYLFLASSAEPKGPIEILAKFATADAAEKLARLLYWADARATA